MWAKHLAAGRHRFEHAESKRGAMGTDMNPGVLECVPADSLPKGSHCQKEVTGTPLNELLRT